MKKIRVAKNWYVYIIILVIIVGCIPRAVELLSGNYLFEFDQGLFFQKVKRIAVDHKLTLIGEEVGGRGGFFQGPGWYYLLSVPFILTKGDPYGAMVMMFLLGVFALVAGAYFSKKMFGGCVSLWVTFFLSVSPAIISQSRFIWNPFPVTAIFVFILYSLFRILQKKEKYVIFLLFSIGLLFHFEIATGISLFIEFGIILLLLLYKRFFRFSALLKGITAFALTQINFLVFDLRHNFLITKGLFKTLMYSPHAITRVYVEHMAANHFDVFKRNFFSAFPLGNKIWPILIIFIILSVYFYVRDKEVKKEQKYFLVYLVISPILLFGIFMTYFWPMWEWWILELLVIYCFLLGILISYMWGRAKAFKPFIFGFIILLSLSHVYSTYNFYRVDYFDYGGVHKMRGKIDALDAIYKDANREKFGLFVFSPPIYTYAYDYLIWWHGEKKYGYKPHNEKKGLFYLLIEKDPQKPWSYKGWLETVIKEGEVIEEKELPSGFIIQKRRGSVGGNLYLHQYI